MQKIERIQEAKGEGMQVCPVAEGRVPTQVFRGSVLQRGFSQPPAKAAPPACPQESSGPYALVFGFHHRFTRSSLKFSFSEGLLLYFSTKDLGQAGFVS